MLVTAFLLAQQQSFVIHALFASPHRTPSPPNGWPHRHSALAAHGLCLLCTLVCTHSFLVLVTGDRIPGAPTPSSSSQGLRWGRFPAMTSSVCNLAFLCISTAPLHVQYIAHDRKPWDVDETVYGGAPDTAHAGGPMQRVHRRGSQVLSEFCEVGYSATLARAQGYSFKGYLYWGKVLAVEGSECTIKWQTEKKPSSHSITDVFLTAFHSIPSSDTASEAPLYPESDHEATDPKTPLRSAAQQNTRTPSDPAKLFLLISSAVQRATDVPVLQCLTAIVINSLEPCIPTH